MKREDGVAGIVIVLSLPVFLLLFTLTAVMGQVFWTHAALQHVVDLAALAGVQSLDYEELGKGQIVIDKVEARRAVRSYLERNLASHRESGRVKVRQLKIMIFNVSPGEPESHHMTGRRLLTPTLCVRLTAAVRPASFLKVPPIEITVLADASVRTR